MTPKQLLEKWAKDDDVEAVVIIGMPKGGGWKWQMTLTTFEFLAGVEGVIQKLKLGAFILPETKKTK